MADKWIQRLIDQILNENEASCRSWSETQVANSLVMHSRNAIESKHDEYMSKEERQIKAVPWALYLIGLETKI